MGYEKRKWSDVTGLFRMRCQEERLATYREMVRARLQELMLRDGLPPGHPLVVRTRDHLEQLTAAEEASKNPSMPEVFFYTGQPIYYSFPVKSAQPLSP